MEIYESMASNEIIAMQSTMAVQAWHLLFRLTGGTMPIINATSRQQANAYTRSCVGLHRHILKAVCFPVILEILRKNFTV